MTLSVLSVYCKFTAFFVNKKIWKMVSIWHSSIVVPFLTQCPVAQFFALAGIVTVNETDSCNSPSYETLFI